MPVPPLTMTRNFVVKSAALGRETWFLRRETTSRRRPSPSSPWGSLRGGARTRWWGLGPVGSHRTEVSPILPTGVSLWLACLRISLLNVVVFFLPFWDQFHPIWCSRQRQFASRWSWRRRRRQRPCGAVQARDHVGRLRQTATPASVSPEIRRGKYTPSMSCDLNCCLPVSPLR